MCFLLFDHLFFWRDLYRQIDFDPWRTHNLLKSPLATKKYQRPPLRGAKAYWSNHWRPKSINLRPLERQEPNEVTPWRLKSITPPSEGPKPTDVTLGDHKVSTPPHWRTQSLLKLFLATKKYHRPPPASLTSLLHRELVVCDAGGA